jgi:hypothetical protein
MNRPLLEFRLEAAKGRALNVLEIKTRRWKYSPHPRRSTPDRLKPELQTGTVSGR